MYDSYYEYYIDTSIILLVLMFQILEKLLDSRVRLIINAIC